MGIKVYAPTGESFEVSHVAARQLVVADGWSLEWPPVTATKIAAAAAAKIAANTAAKNAAIAASEAAAAKVAADAAAAAAAAAVTGTPASTAPVAVPTPVIHTPKPAVVVEVAVTPGVATTHAS